ncbi:MAG: glycogen-binding domain-containing protein [Gammaproteobacteria bacterium]
MTVGRPAGAAVVAAAWSVAAAPGLAAQVTGTVEAAISRVHYDDFLASGAASLSTSVSVQGQALAFGARATYLRFESGNTTWQAATTGSYFADRVGPSRPEVWAAVGGSRYVSFPAFWHALAGTRFHFPLERGTAWVDGSIGRTSFGGESRLVTMVGAAAWTRRFGPTLTLGASYVRVGDTTYTDLQGTARARRGAIEVDGVFGTRLWSRGGGHGAYGEGSLAILVGSHGAVVLAGGRYATDPTRGTIAGRYVSGGIRLRALATGRRRPASPAPPLPTAPGSHRTAASDAATLLELRPEGRDTIRLIVHAQVAGRVEVAGDFTGWHAIALAPTAPGRWEAVARIPRGHHRINVRIDGGSWFAPGGTTPAPDDYGGETGSFVIP